MKHFVIIDIEQNTVQPDGDVLIVKANQVKAAEGFETLDEMFGKKYFNFVMNECDETETFMLPYSEELAQGLVRLAHRYKDGEYWTPDMDEFMDASLSTSKGLMTIHKSMVLVRRRMGTERQKYIPPVADWEFKHRVVDGIKLTFISYTFSAKIRIISAKSNFHFNNFSQSWVYY